MKLVSIQECDIEKSYQLHQTFDQDENGFINDAFHFTKEQFKNYVKQCDDYSKGLNLPEGYVPCTHYILINDEDEYVGLFKFRHELNEFLRNDPGHIGYGISNKYRGKGYASKGLKLCLDIARDMNIDELYLSCYKSNPASLKVQQNNGAYIHHESDDHYLTRIPLKDKEL